jgi:hypothetical protein
MKLEGSLDAFSLPDMFQLLSFTKKTGGLHLANDDADGVVFFAGGRVTGASADGSRQPLARRLVGSGVVEDDALAAAVEAAANGEGVGVVRALLESQAVDAELLRQAATDQAVDAVFDLLRWDRGNFAFVVEEGNPDDVGVALAVDTVLADAEKRSATWETVSQVVPSSQAVLAMPVVLPTDPAVSREEWSLLALVDGRRSVEELVDLTGSGRYAVVSTLAALVQRGLLEVQADSAAGDGEPDHVSVVIRRQQLLAPLENRPYAPVATVAAEETPGGASARTVAGQPSPEQGDDGGPAGGSVGDHAGDKEPVTASAGGDGQTAMLGGAHVPQDVVPPRPEPFLPKRQADFDETGSPSARHAQVQAGPSATVGEVIGATVTAPDPDAASVIERDPNVNRSLMLRLIAGVRGL